MRSHSLALVVIGKDSEKQLSATYKREVVEELSCYLDELIYVDSCSSDGSAAMMKAVGFRTYRLVDCESPCASIGRRVGTEISRCDYILYLDSDMAIQNPKCFFENINSVIDCGRTSGCVGKVIDVYPNGNTRERVRKVKNKCPATSFGGFVVLNRNDVISCGNWSASLKANEELDLYVRLRASGKNVIYLDTIEVKHFTVINSRMSELMSLYLPTRPARYGALGKVAKQMKSIPSFCWLVRMNKEVFILLFLFLISLLISLSVELWILVGLICFVAVAVVRGWKYNFVVPGLLLSLCVGLIIPVNKNRVLYEEV